MKKAIIDQSICDKSPVCIAQRVCPVGAITLITEGASVSKIDINKDKCIGCAKCVRYCPHNAINMN